MPKISKNQKIKIVKDLKKLGVEVCVVSKYVGVAEVEKLLEEVPNIGDFGENRWPDCEKKFEFLGNLKLKRHFIGPLQTNKVKKVLPLVELIQSVDSEKLMQKIQIEAEKLDNKLENQFYSKSTSKIFEIFFQVNISEDPKKHGLTPEKTIKLIKIYKKAKENQELKNLELTGLMTIGAQTELENRRQYFREFKQFFDQINQEFFPKNPLKYLSMGMSADYQIAVEEGSNMVRLGSLFFK